MNTVSTDKIKTEPSESAKFLPFTAIPNEILDNKNITAKGKLLMVYLLKYAAIPGWVYHNHLMKEFLECGRDGLESAFKSLREAGYVTNVVIKGPTGLCGSKRIFSRIPEFLEANEGINDNPVDKSVDNLTSRCPEIKGPRSKCPTETGILERKSIKNTDIKNKDKKIYKKDFSLEFEEFWTLYPRKVKKHNSKEVYFKLLSENPELHEVIIQAVLEQASERKIKEELGIGGPQDIQYIPHPTSWLRAERWTDITESREQLNERVKRSKSRVNRPLSKIEERNRLLKELERKCLEEDNAMSDDEEDEEEGEWFDADFKVIRDI